MKAKLLVGVFLAGLMLLVACGKTQEVPMTEESKPEPESVVQQEEEETVQLPHKGGTLYMSIENQQFYNPLLETNANTGQFLNLLFSPLIELDETCRPCPAIASKWQLSEDNQQAIIWIDTSIQWHNGKKVSPVDVVFTIQTLKEAEESLYKECVANIKSAEVMNGESVLIEFKEPSMLNLNKLYFPVISKEYYSNNMEAMLMGSGMYKVEEYIPMKKMLLTANANYYGNKPYIEQIEVSLTYSDVRKESFQQKLTSLVYMEDINWGEYVDRENVGVHIFGSNEAILLGYNMESVDADTRKAIAYALDAQEILASVYLGKGTVSEVPVDPEYWYAPTDPSLYRYDPQKVSALLDLSQEMTLRLLVNREDVLETEIAEELQIALQKQGIEIQILEKNSEEYITAYINGEYDLAVLSEKILDLEDLKGLLEGTSVSMDRILEEAQQKNKEQEVHQSIAEMTKLVSEEMPYYSLFVLKQATLTGNGILGKLQPTPYNVYRGIENLYMED